jgi:hypothetical protein
MTKLTKKPSHATVPLIVCMGEGGEAGMVLHSWAKIGDVSNYSTRNLSIDIVANQLSVGSLIWPCRPVVVKFKFVTD